MKKISIFLISLVSLAFLTSSLKAQLEIEKAASTLKSHSEGDILFMVHGYTGRDVNACISYVNPLDFGKNYWFPDRPLGYSDATPDVCNYNAKLWIAYVDYEYDPDRIFVRFSSDDGSIWSAPETFMDAYDPALVSYGGKLYLFYCDADGDIYYSTYQSGTWSYAGEMYSGQTKQGEGIEAIVHNNKIYVFYKGHSATNNKIYCSYYNGYSWTQIELPGEMKKGAGAVIFNNNIYIFHRGDDSKYLYYCHSYNGTDWSDDTRILTAETDQKPCGAVIDGTLYVYYKGESSDYIFYSYSNNGSTWYGNLYLNNGAKSSSGISITNYHLVTEKSAETEALKQDAMETLKISCYPNPMSGNFYVELNDKECSGYKILDNSGRVVLTDSNMHRNSINIDISYESEGIYYIQMNTTDSQIICEKLVLKR